MSIKLIQYTYSLPLIRSVLWTWPFLHQHEPNECALCQTQTKVAPDGQASALHGSSAAIAVCVCLCVCACVCVSVCLCVCVCKCMDEWEASVKYFECRSVLINELCKCCPLTILPPFSGRQNSNPVFLSHHLTDREPNQLTLWPSI